MTDTRGSGSQKQLPEPHFLKVGMILRAWSIRGDVKVQPTAIRPEQIQQLKRIFVGPHHREYKVQSFRAHQKNWLLKLEGVDTRNDAELLHDQWISIERKDQPPLTEDEYYSNQIIGLQVETIDGTALGIVTEILKTGANDVYVVNGNRGEILLPAQAEVIRSIDVEQGIMIVKLLPGME
jgi:16S rRNA processing protein RimM